MHFTHLVSSTVSVLAKSPTDKPVIINKSIKMPVSCKIHFDQNENAVFFAGQLLSGSVQISLTNTKRLRGIMHFLKIAVGQINLAIMPTKYCSVHPINSDPS